MCVSFCFRHSSHWTFRSAYETWIRIPVPQLLLNCHRDRLTLKESSQRFSYSNLQKVNFPWAILFFSIEKLDFFNYILFFSVLNFWRRQKNHNDFRSHLVTDVLSEKSSTKMYLSAGQLGRKTFFLVVLGSLFFTGIFAKEKVSN